MSVFDKVVCARERAILCGATPQELRLRISSSAMDSILWENAGVRLIGKDGVKLLGMDVEVVPDFQIIRKAML